MKKILGKMTFLAIMTLPIVSLTAEAGPFEKADRLFVDSHILPRVDALKQQTEVFAKQVETACQAASLPMKSDLYAAYNEAADSWQNFQHIRIGALTDFNQFHRLQFWPDKRNNVGKDLQKLEAEIAAGGKVTKGDLYKGSVAAQGFPLMERLLFDGKSEKGSAQMTASDCMILTAASGNVAHISDYVVRGWTDEGGYADEFKQTLEEKELYPDEGSVVTALLGNLLTGLQWVEDSKLRKAMDDSAKKAKPKRLESWRSGRSFHNVKLNLLALQESYEILFHENVLTLENGARLDQNIAGNFDQALKIVAALESHSVFDLKKPEIWAQVNEIAALIKAIRADLILAAGGLNIHVGFNSLDGD